MKYIAFIVRMIIICASFSLLSCSSLAKNQDNIDGFISEMVNKHQFSEIELTELFNHVEWDETIIKRIAKPSESLPWYKYRKIFLKLPRIKAGVKFWQENAETLAKVERETGVPAAIIVAIIGVETEYGRHTGNYRVIDALSTLAFAYPPRSPFFRKELEQFLLLCRSGHINPLIPNGSYAGAMGIPQFMPSSYRTYAIDYNKDNRIDIWHDRDDVIASIGNYFAKHGWQKDQAVIIKLRDIDHNSVNLLATLKEDLSYIQSNAVDPNISKPLFSTKKAKIIAFKQENGEELWGALDNFYVITRYNHSPLYAMAVYQLSLAISNLRVTSPYEKNHTPAICSGTCKLFEPAN